MAFLADGVIWIWHQHGQRIGEHGRCFIEGDLIIVQIGFRLAHFPFELVAHGSTVRLSRADANNGANARLGREWRRRFETRAWRRHDRREYGFSSGIGAKHHEVYHRGPNLTSLEPDVAEVFKDSGAVNAALRALQHGARMRDPGWLPHGPFRSSDPSTGARDCQLESVRRLICRSTDAVLHSRPLARSSIDWQTSINASNDSASSCNHPSFTIRA